MATQKQIDANRRNAASSTGPRSPEGKTASRMNALRTGIDARSQIIRGENPAVLESLAAEYYARFNPATPEQRYLVDTLVNCDWLTRRLRAIEAQLWERDFAYNEKLEQYEKRHALGDTFVREHETFLHLQRRIDSTDRAYHRAFRILRGLQSPDSKAAGRANQRKSSIDPPVPPVFAPSDARIDPHPPSQIGFVPPNPRQHTIPNPRERSEPLGVRLKQNQSERWHLGTEVSQETRNSGGTGGRPASCSL